MRSLLLICTLLAAAPFRAGVAQELPQPAPEATEVVEAPAVEEEQGTPPPQTPGEWRERVEQLAVAIEAGEKQPKEADELYPQLDEVLRKALDGHRGAFRKARRASDPVPPASGERGDDWVEMGGTVADLYASLDTLYRARLRMLDVVTPQLREELTGNGVVGVEQFWLEVDFVRRMIRYQRVAIPDGVRRVLRKVRTAPVPSILGGLIAIAALAVFRVWRKWAKQGLPQLRELTQRAWRHHAAARSFATFLRYLERTRRPLEWLLLFWVVFGLFQLPEVRELEGVLRIVVRTLLTAWLLVSLADALARRPSRAGVVHSEERDKASLHSLWLLAAWGLVPAVGLRLSEHLAGHGTLYTWVWHLFELMFIPVAVLLLVIWRPLILQRLEREANFSTWVAKLMQRRGLLGNLAAAVGGLAYLALFGVRRLGLKLVRRTALGRTLVAEALRQSMTRSSDGQVAAEVPELDPDLRKRWLRGEGIVESAVAEELAEVLEMVERGWRSVVLVGERGAGKSVLLQRLAEELEGGVLVVTCPHGGAKEAYAALCRALELEDAAAPPEALNQAFRSRGVRLLAWDDIHRICRPVLGGQSELNLLLELLDPLDDVPMLAAIDSAAWEYISRVREGTISGSSTVVLSAWTEDQIGELLESRAREVGMELDYGGLSFPRLLLEDDFDTPEEGLRASYQRILWAEAEGNPEVALRLIVNHLVEKDDGDGLLRLPRTRSAAELGNVTLVELMVLRFLIQTDGATLPELVAGLRYPQHVIDNVLVSDEMRGLLEENHGRYRIGWKWYRTITRVLTRRNMLGAARQRKEQGVPAPGALGPRRGSYAMGAPTR